NKGGFKAYFPADAKEDDVTPPTFPQPGKKKAEPPPFTGGMVMAAMPDESKVAMAIGMKFRTGVSGADREKPRGGFTDTVTRAGGGEVALKVLGEREIRGLGQKGKETVVEGPATDGTMQLVIRQVAVGSNAYFGAVGAKNGRPKPEDENGFFDNFEVLK